MLLLEIQKQIPADLRKILILQKRFLRLIFFCNTRSHAIPWFVSSNILLIEMLCFETVSTLMHDISNSSVPKNIQKLFNRSSNMQKYNTRSSAMGNYYVSESRLSLQLKSFVNFGTRLWNSLHSDWRALTKRPFNQRIRKFQRTVLGVEDAYVDPYSFITKLNNHYYRTLFFLFISFFTLFYLFIFYIHLF